MKPPSVQNQFSILCTNLWPCFAFALFPDAPTLCLATPRPSYMFNTLQMEKCWHRVEAIRQYDSGTSIQQHQNTRVRLTRIMCFVHLGLPTLHVLCRRTRMVCWLFGILKKAHRLEKTLELIDSGSLPFPGNQCTATPRAKDWPLPPKTPPARFGTYAHNLSWSLFLGTLILWKPSSGEVRSCCTQRVAIGQSKFGIRIVVFLFVR
mmetsp:Transcript_11222/g.27035  ORF Transcript_11222/g.27035 Transcript_11222/m.27035 type:complete len:206 (-) Transcript_11222:681-1298(-)